MTALPSSVRLTLSRLSQQWEVLYQTRQKRRRPSLWGLSAMKRLLLWAEGGEVTVSLSNLLDCLWPSLAAIHLLSLSWRMPVGVETCKTPVIPQWRNSDLFSLSLCLSLPACDISLFHSRAAFCCLKLRRLYSFWEPPSGILSPLPPCTLSSLWAWT